MALPNPGIINSEGTVSNVEIRPTGQFTPFVPTSQTTPIMPPTVAQQFILHPPITQQPVHHPPITQELVLHPPRTTVTPRTIQPISRTIPPLINIPPLSQTIAPSPSVSGTKKSEKITPEKIPIPLQLNIPPERYNSPMVRQKMKQNPKIYILYKVVTNILTILRKRGYAIPEEFDDLKTMTPNEFILTYLQKVGENQTLREYLSRDFYRRDRNNPGKLEIIHVNYPETPVAAGTTTKSQTDPLVNVIGGYDHETIMSSGKPGQGTQCGGESGSHQNNLTHNQ